MEERGLLGILLAESRNEKIFDGFANNNVEQTLKAMDWLDKKMFDYRGLIPMDIALPAKKGMYI